MQQIDVLYIAGIGRSGSTLLCRTLGGAKGLLATGELMRILGRGVINRDACSCGAPVPDCPFWADVLADVERRSPGLDYERLEATRKRVTEGWEFLRYFFTPLDGTALGRDLNEYRAFLATLYQSIVAVSGARVIVDASKNLMFARLLTETPGIRLSVLHLVRDSRGVAHSLARRQPRPGTAGRQEFFRQQGPLLGSILWNTAHVTTERLGKRTGRLVRMRYEDFVAHPRASVASVLDQVTTAGAFDLAHVNGHSVRLSTDHLIASNPNRERQGDVPLREDTAWRTEMKPSARWVVTAVTFPLLRRYGYALRPDESAPRPRPSLAQQPDR